MYKLNSLNVGKEGAKAALYLKQAEELRKKGSDMRNKFFERCEKNKEIQKCEEMKKGDSWSCEKMVACTMQ